MGAKEVKELKDRKNADRSGKERPGFAGVSAGGADLAPEEVIAARRAGEVAECKSRTELAVAEGFIPKSSSDFERVWEVGVHDSQPLEGVEEAVNGEHPWPHLLHLPPLPLL